MLITAEDAKTFQQDGVTAVGYASPSRGVQDLSLWRLQLAPEEGSPVHRLTREEVFLVLAGSGSATIEGVTERFGAGDCLVVPPGLAFSLAAGADGLEAVCAMAAG